MQIIVCWNFLVLDSIPLSNIPTPHQKHQANSLMKQNKSLKFISFLQTLAIILVVTGHSLHEYPENNGFSTLAYHLIYSFHMPLFIFISGYLFRYTQTNKETPQPYSTFFKKNPTPYSALSVFMCDNLRSQGIDVGLRQMSRLKFHSPILSAHCSIPIKCPSLICGSSPRYSYYLTYHISPTACSGSLNRQYYSSCWQ